MEGFLQGRSPPLPRFFAKSGTSHYATRKIPFAAPFDGSTFRIPAADRQRMFDTMIRVDEASMSTVGFPLANLYTLTTSTENPEERLETWAQANYPGDPSSEDTWLSSSAWNQLTGSTYSEDLAGDGSAIATITIDPISTANPEGRIRLRLNGREIVVGNPRHEPHNGGWLRTSSYMSSSSYSTGGTTVRVNPPTNASADVP